MVILITPFLFTGNLRSPLWAPQSRLTNPSAPISLSWKGGVRSREWVSPFALAVPRAGVNLRYLSSHRVSNQTEPEDLTLENRCKFSKEAFVIGARGWLKLNLYLLFATEYFFGPWAAGTFRFPKNWSLHRLQGHHRNTSSGPSGPGTGPACWGLA